MLAGTGWLPPSRKKTAFPLPSQRPYSSSCDKNYTMIDNRCQAFFLYHKIFFYILLIFYDSRDILYRRKEGWEMIVSHLSRILGDRRIKQRELALKAGLSLNTVANIYHDRWGMIDRETLDRVCKALGVEIADLLEYVSEDESEEEVQPKRKAKTSGK
jgi:putative transcriptional regulator